MLHSQHFLFVTLSEFVGAATVQKSILHPVYTRPKAYPTATREAFGKLTTPDDSFSLYTYFRIGTTFLRILSRKFHPATCWYESKK
jgi:hypothetical protein